MPGSRGARSSAARSSSTVRTSSCVQPYSAAAWAKSRPCGVAMCCSKASRSPATGRNSKIPPPSLLSRTIVSSRPGAPRGEQAADVVGERDVADEQDDRPVGHRGRAERARHGAVDAVRAAVAEHARRVGAHGDVRLDVAHRHRRRDEQRGRRGQACPELAGDARLGQLLSQHLVDRARGALVGVAPSGEPGGVRGRRVARGGGERRLRVGGQQHVQRARRVVPGRLRVERELRHAGIEPAEPGAQRLRGREVAAAHDEVRLQARR